MDVSSIWGVSRLFHSLSPINQDWCLWSHYHLLFGVHLEPSFSGHLADQMREIVGSELAQVNSLRRLLWRMF